MQSYTQRQTIFHHTCRCDGSSEDFTCPCYPILPDGDAPCIRVTRSAAVCQEHGYPKPREQINVNTAPIDASQVYGSTERVAEELRETEPGMFACVHRLRTVHRCKMSDLPKVHHVSKLNNKQLLGFGFCDMHNNQCYQRQQLSLEQKVRPLAL